MEQAHDGMPMDSKMSRHHYMMLALNLAISLAIMYLAMFAMIFSLGEFIQNINFLYMSLVMWAPMGVLMLLTMRQMYTNSRLNLALYALFGAIFVLSLLGIRTQGLVEDRQFVRSMIPHHSGALLMCQQASLRDAELRELCFGPNGIVASQKREILQMKSLLDRL